MVKVKVGKQSVAFELEGAQKFLAMKGRVNIPFRKIQSISTETAKPWPWIAHRIGTHLPRVFMAGTFWTKEGKIFYYVRNRSKCITLTLREHDYSKVVFEVDYKERVARALREAI